MIFTTGKERIEIKLNLAKENRPVAEGHAYAMVRYYQGVVDTCKFVLELLEKGD